MSKTQAVVISPPQPGEKGTKDFAVTVQQNVATLFELAHEHNVLRGEPTAESGTIGDIKIVETDGLVRLAVRTSTGWHYFTEVISED